MDETEDPDQARHQLFLRAFDLRWQLEDGVPGAPEEIQAVLAAAEAKGWPEVRRAALYTLITCANRAHDGTLKGAVERLLDQAQADGDSPMIALALAYRANTWVQNDDGSLTAAADADLARATALLEHEDGSALERITAHNRCAIAYGQLQLFELEQKHYEAAEMLVDCCEDTRRVAALRFNEAEASLNWACDLRHMGDHAGVRARVDAGMRALQACSTVEMPAMWRWELQVISTVLAAVGGEDVSARAHELLGEIGTSPSYEGHLELAIALSLFDRDPVKAAACLEKAVGLIDPVESPPAHDLALRSAAELEQSRIGSPTAGLRYGKQQVELRWSARLAKVAAMEELVSGERLRTETEFLRRQAFLDELTGLANRRGYIRYVSTLATRCPEQVALIIVDVDRFKQVNDNYGHAAGDATLFRIARILTRAIRSEDLAARLGGDEFAVILAGAGVGVGAARARAILDAITREPWDEVRSGLCVRASVGVVAGEPVRFEQLEAMADAELYRAKAAGGARSSVAR